MPDPARLPTALFATRWVHVFEEDGPEGAVFLPENADIPLSRRPRVRLAFAEDGSGTFYGPGADDRPVGRPLTWHLEEAGRVVARTEDGAALGIRVMSPSRLLVTGLPDR